MMLAMRNRSGFSHTHRHLFSCNNSDLPALLKQEQNREATIANSAPSQNGPLSPELSHLSDLKPGHTSSTDIESYQRSSLSEIKPLLPPSPSERSSNGRPRFNAKSVWQTFLNIVDRCFQPPVFGAVTGILVAVTPARGIFVDLVDRDSDAPLQWMFDGLYAVGLTAVPINMMILGCNLSASQKSLQQGEDNVAKEGEGSSGLMSMSTMLGIVVGKMIIMPFIGISTGWILKQYVWTIPDDIDGSFYLVLSIVFLTPTANNVMVMVELSGSNAKEGIARVIALQYAVAPLILSLTMTIAIGVATSSKSAPPPCC